MVECEKIEKIVSLATKRTFTQCLSVQRMAEDISVCVCVCTCFHPYVSVSLCLFVLGLSLTVRSYMKALIARVTATSDHFQKKGSETERGRQSRLTLTPER